MDKAPASEVGNFVKTSIAHQTNNTIHQIFPEILRIPQTLEIPSRFTKRQRKRQNNEPVQSCMTHEHER